LEKSRTSPACLRARQYYHPGGTKTEKKGGGGGKKEKEESTVRFFAAPLKISKRVAFERRIFVGQTKKKTETGEKGEKGDENGAPFGVRVWKR